MAKESMIDRIRYVQDTLHVINGKWKWLILLSMHEGVHRFRDLQRSIPQITTRVLSKELKELEANKLIVRTVHDTYPITIKYTLTAYGNSINPVVEEMIRWGKAHRKKISGK